MDQQMASRRCCQSMSRVYAYAPEVIEFARTHCEARTNAQLADLINQEYGTALTAASMKSFMANHKIRRRVRGQYTFYTALYPEQIHKYIHENYKGVGPKEMAERLNAEFGTEYTRAQIKGFYCNHGLNSGLDGRWTHDRRPDTSKMKGRHLSTATEFKKGQKALNKMDVGTVIVNSDGYKMIKTGDPHQWEFLHRKVWQEKNGPIPEGHMIIFLDGNRLNCEPENLRLVSKAENAVLNSHGMRFSDPELTEMAANLAKLTVVAGKKKRKKHGQHN